MALGRGFGDLQAPKVLDYQSGAQVVVCATDDTSSISNVPAGSEFATDFSNASTTGLFDPYEVRCPSFPSWDPRLGVTPSGP